MSAVPVQPHQQHISSYVQCIIDHDVSSLAESVAWILLFTGQGKKKLSFAALQGMLSIGGKRHIERAARELTDTGLVSRYREQIGKGHPYHWTLTDPTEYKPPVFPWATSVLRGSVLSAHLSHSEMRVLSRLVMAADSDGQVRLPVNVLADRCGMSSRTFVKHAETLSAAFAPEHGGLSTWSVERRCGMPSVAVACLSVPTRKAKAWIERNTEQAEPDVWDFPNVDAVFDEYVTKLDESGLWDNEELPLWGRNGVWQQIQLDVVASGNKFSKHHAIDEYMRPVMVAYNELLASNNGDWARARHQTQGVMERAAKYRNGIRSYGGYIINESRKLQKTDRW